MPAFGEIIILPLLFTNDADDNMLAPDSHEIVINNFTGWWATKLLSLASSWEDGSFSA